MRLFLTAAGISVFAIACAGPPVRSTVDAYGEIPIERTQSLCFVRDASELRDRPIADSCRDAARDAGIPIAEMDKPGGCHYVVVSGHLASATRDIETTGSAFGGYSRFGGRRGGWGPGFGMGYGTAQDSKEYADRQVSITIYADAARKNAVRSIDIRSSGAQSSVPAVAYEMCEAAFRDFPKNLRGQVYDTSRRDPTLGK